MNKEKILKIFYLVLLLSPIIDLITSLMTKFTSFPITLGIVVRGTIFILLILYVFLITKSKYKKLSMIYLGILFILFILYFVTKLELVQNFSFFFKEIIYLFKYMYFPVTFIGLLNLFEDYKFDKEKIFRYLNINLIFYCSVILLATITNTSFSTYKFSGGNTGWYYSGNEIGVITTILYPLILLLIDRKNCYKYLLLILPIVFSIDLIGTKTATLGIFIPSFLLLIYYFLKFKEGKKKQFFSILIIILFIICTARSLPVINTISGSIERYYYRLTNNEDQYSKNIAVTVLLSDRDLYYKNIKKIYNKSNIFDKLFGVGFNNRSTINNKNVTKLIEMDFFDIFFRYGILLFICYCLPILLLAFSVMKKIFEIKFELDLKSLVLIYTIGISLTVSFLAGHVLGAPAVSSYISLIMVLLIYCLNNLKHKN